MLLTDTSIIKKGTPLWGTLDVLSFLSKNLYNAALYATRQYYFAKRETLTWQSLSKNFVKHHNPDYYALPTKVSKEVLIQVGRTYASFFKLLGKKRHGDYPHAVRLPKYKNKTRGRNIITFQAQTIGKPTPIGNGLFEYTVCARSLDMKLISRFSDVMMIRIVPGTDCYQVQFIHESPEPVDLSSSPVKYASIDLGVDNLATIWSGAESFIVNGRPLKAVNQYYNKQLALMRASWDRQRRNSDARVTRRMSRLTAKRNALVKDYLHRASRLLVNQLASIHVTDIIIGYNKEWKQDANMGRKSNQKFVMIPHEAFLNMIKYKAELAGMRTILTEESFTSKCSFVDHEELCRHDTYQGRRVHRGLFRTHDNVFVNADVNGAANIMRKVIGTQAYACHPVEDAAVQPTRLTPGKH